MSLTITARVPATIATIEAMCEGLAGLNFRLMRIAQLGGGGFPELYGSGIVYRRERPGKEHWQTAADLLETGEGDCEDLSAYRVGELRLQGVPARVAVVRTPRGSYHAVVEYLDDGAIEDPSRILLALEGVSQANLR